MSLSQTRRDCVATLLSAGAVGLLGADPGRADEPPPETTAIQLLKDPTCGAPISIAEELLGAEGFTEVQFVDFEPQRPTPR